MKGGGNLIIGAAFYIDGGGGRPPQRYGRSATGLRLLQAADSAEVSYTVASMTISIDAKCYCSRLYQVT